MANQREMDEIPLSSFDEGRLAFLGDIPLDAEQQDTASFIHDQGFKSVMLYWPSERFEPMEWKHQGYCMAEFLLRNEAQEPIKKLPDGIFKGRHLKATVPGHKQPSSNLNLPAEAKAIPAEADAITSAVELRKALQKLKCPDAYVYSERWSKNDVEGAVMGRMMEREKESQSPGSLVVENGDRVRSQPTPSTARGDSTHCSTIWIYVTRFESDERKLKRITLPELPLYQGNGWHEWFKGEVQAEEGTDRDKRNILMVEDVNVSDDPKEDTLKMFRTAINIYQKADAIHWKPGHVLAATNGTREAPMSTSKAFIPPNVSGNDLPSATSRGHHHRYRRPAKIGVGWGDYDHFREWQLRGRRLDVDMVEEKPWYPRIKDQVQFRVLGEGAETQGDSVTADSCWFRPTLSEPINLPVSLRVKLETAKAVRVARGGIGRGGALRGPALARW